MTNTTEQIRLKISNQIREDFSREISRNWMYQANNVKYKNKFNELFITFTIIIFSLWLAFKLI